MYTSILYLTWQCKGYIVKCISYMFRCEAVLNITIPKDLSLDHGLVWFSNGVPSSRVKCKLFIEGRTMKINFNLAL